MSNAAANRAATPRTSRRPYLITFAILGALTVAELAVARTPGVARAALAAALVLLALTKAGLVLMSFMHLGHETRALKLTVILPFLLPLAYAVTLIAEASWRATP